MIGERLSELRKDKKMTQEDLAKLLSVTKSTICAYENDRSTPSCESLLAIARHFNISLDYLYGLIDDELALNRENVMILPRKFPDAVKEEMLDYAEFRRARKKCRKAK